MGSISLLRKCTKNQGFFVMFMILEIFKNRGAKVNSVIVCHFRVSYSCEWVALQVSRLLNLVVPPIILLPITTIEVDPVIVLD